MVKKDAKSPIEKAPEPQTTGEVRRETNRRYERPNPNFVQGTIEPTSKKKK